MGNEEKTQKKKKIEKGREKKKNISKMAVNMGLGEGSVLAIKSVLKSRDNFQRVNLNLQF